MNSLQIRPSEVVAWISTGTLALSMSHVFGMSLGVGVDVARYLQLQDYIRLALVWLPFAATASAGGVLTSYAWTERAVSEGSAPELAAMYTRVTRVMTPVGALLALLGLMILNRDERMGRFLINIGLLGVLVGGPLFLWRWLDYFEEDKSKPLHRRATYALYVLVIACGLAFSTGLDSGFRGRLIWSDSDPARITTSDGAIFEGQVFLALTDYTLMYPYRSNTLQVIPNGRIQLVEHFDTGARGRLRVPEETPVAETGGTAEDLSTVPDTVAEPEPAAPEQETADSSGVSGQP